MTVVVFWLFQGPHFLKIYVLFPHPHVKSQQQKQQQQKQGMCVLKLWNVLNNLRENWCSQQTSLPGVPHVGLVIKLATKLQVIRRNSVNCSFHFNKHYTKLFKSWRGFFLAQIYTEITEVPLKTVNRIKWSKRKMSESLRHFTLSLSLAVNLWLRRKVICKQIFYFKLKPCQFQTDWFFGKLWHMQGFLPCITANPSCSLLTISAEIWLFLRLLWWLEICCLQLYPGASQIVTLAERLRMLLQRRLRFCRSSLGPEVTHL